jgi:hypothetical protein
MKRVKNQRSYNIIFTLNKSNYKTFFGIHLRINR